LLALVACGDRARLTQGVSIETLPGGIPSVTTVTPIDSGRWSLVPVRDVGPAPGQPGEFLNPTDLALAEDGTLFVVEWSPAAINRYRPDGAFSATVARQGAGPGEVRNAWIAVRGDTLVVQDPDQTRTTTLDGRDGRVLQVRTTICCRRHPIAIDGAGRAVLWMRAVPEDDPRPRQEFLRFALTDTVMETVTIPEARPDPGLIPWQVERNGEVLFTEEVPLRPRSIHAVDARGGFVTAWTGRYAIVATPNGGDSTMVFGRPFTPEPVSASEKQSIVDQVVTGYDLSWWNGTVEALRAAFTTAAIPDQRPAIEGLWTDGAGRRWVMLSSADTSRVTLDLFDPEGRWLDQIVLPGGAWPARGWQPVSFASTHVAVLLQSPDGAPVVRIYRIARSES
jgi:hypothetical protein